MPELSLMFISLFLKKLLFFSLWVLNPSWFRFHFGSLLRFMNTSIGCSYAINLLRVTRLPGLSVAVQQGALLVCPGLWPVLDPWSSQNCTTCKGMGPLLDLPLMLRVLSAVARGSSLWSRSLTLCIRITPQRQIQYIYKTQIRTVLIRAWRELDFPIIRISL